MHGQEELYFFHMARCDSHVHCSIINYAVIFLAFQNYVHSDNAEFKSILSRPERVTEIKCLCTLTYHNKLAQLEYL